MNQSNNTGNELGQLMEWVTQHIQHLSYQKSEQESLIIKLQSKIQQKAEDTALIDHQGMMNNGTTVQGDFQIYVNNNKKAGYDCEIQGRRMMVITLIEQIEHHNEYRKHLKRIGQVKDPVERINQIKQSLSQLEQGLDVVNKGIKE